jgi:protein-S-isoprenylcysteine O-methyltransferase Ste14
METRDRNLTTIPGLVAAAIWLLLVVAVTVLALTSLTGGDAVSWTGVTAATLLALLLVLALNGFVVVQPNQARWRSSSAATRGRSGAPGSTLSTP